MPDPTVETVSAQIDDAIKTHPWLGPFFKIPGLGSFLTQAVVQGWIDNPTLFSQNYVDSEWYKSTPPDQRTWVGISIIDPASAQARLDEQNKRAQNLLRDLGISLTWENMPEFALLVSAAATHATVGQGWDDARFSQELARYMLGNAQNANELGNGTVGQTYHQVQGLASDYGLPMSEKQAINYATQIATGQATLDTVHESLQHLASGMFPQFADAINRGQTVRQAVDPYIQQAAQMLDKAPEEIKLSDPLYQPILTTRDKANNHAPLSLLDWSTKIMTDPNYKWDHSTQGKQLGVQIVTNLQRTFGKLGSA